MQLGYAVLDMDKGKGLIMHIFKSPHEAEEKLNVLRKKHPRKTYKATRITAFQRKPRKIYT